MQATKSEQTTKSFTLGLRQNRAQRVEPGTGASQQISLRLGEQRAGRVARRAQEMGMSVPDYIRFLLDINVGK